MKRFKKVLEVACMVSFIAWIIAVSVDYNRFKNDLPPIFTFDKIDSSLYQTNGPTIYRGFWYIVNYNYYSNSIHRAIYTQEEIQAYYQMENRPPVSKFFQILWWELGYVSGMELPIPIE